jgi:two-component system, NarL family, response regulator LiaR
MSQSDTPVRIALVDDHAIVVRGLAAMLADHADRVRVVELDSLRDPPDDVDVVLKDAFGMVDDLREFVASTKAPVVVFAFATDHDAVQAALDVGVSGYVYKGVSEETLVAALERVHRGERVVELEGVDDGDDGGEPGDEPGDWPGRQHGLSEREAEILTLICRGMSNQQAAEQLYLSINSVKTYIRTAYRKIGAQSRSQAVIWGLRHGFVPTPQRMRPPAGD